MLYTHQTVQFTKRQFTSFFGVGRPPPDHGNIFFVDDGARLVDLILPANTRAFSLFVGSSAGGSARTQAFDDHNNQTGRIYFRVGNDNTRGYGIYATGCSSLTRIAVEPFEWGFGCFSSNEGECRSATEPGTLPLLGLGLLALALTRRIRLHRQLACYPALDEIDEGAARPLFFCGREVL